jgi:hypothetical protein
VSPINRLGEHGVDVVDAGEHLRLQAAAATRAHEGVGVLKLRVPVDGRASDIALAAAGCRPSW